MHWCANETMALMAVIPILGIIFRKLHVWYHMKIKHKCHAEGCNETHVEHREDSHENGLS